VPSAGERTCWCEFLEPPAPSDLGEVDPNPQRWPVWSAAFGKKRGLRGGELILARESQAQLTEEFYFDYADVMDPIGDGKKLNERMVIRFDDEIYDIDGVFAEEGKRREVRVMAIRKRQAV
jgi:Phage head-tail joining protein